MEDKLNIFLAELKKTKQLVASLNSAVKSDKSPNTSKIIEDLEILKEQVSENSDLFEAIFKNNN